MARTKITKRKGIAGLTPPTRNKAAKTADEVECGQLRCEVHALEVQRAGLWKTQRELEEQKREVEEQLREVLREVEHVQQNLATDRKRIEELENNQRLGKLPQEVWAKVLDELGENDLFPLALSCRFFRQKQKELVARSRESGPESGKPRLTLKTTLHYRPVQCPPASAEYLQFLKNCEILPVDRVDDSKALGRTESEYVEFIYPAHLEASFVKDKCIRRVAAYHGHLPLLQELLEESYEKDPEDLAQSAGESFSLRFSSSLWLLTCFSSSQCAEASWRPCSG